MDRWVGKVAVVTGASAGIGAAIAVTLANAGLKVVGVARRPELVEALKNQVKTAKGELHALKCDVGKEEDIIALFQWVRKNLGSVHVLVNNAGIVRPTMLLEQDTKLIKEVLDVNVIGLTVCTREAFKLMKETGVDDGHIIHINSVAGHIIPAMSSEFGIYPASKFAVTAITETHRRELRTLKLKTKVTSISPGYVETDIINAAMKGLGKSDEKSASEELLPELKDMPALESQDIADAVVYVLGTPPRVQIHELTIKPVGETF